MKFLRFLLLGLTLSAFATMSVAQMAEEKEIKEITEKYDSGLSKRPSLPLLDFSRLQMSQSYGISFFSGDGYSGSYALYSNTIRYQLAQPLTLTLNLSILHDPGALWNDKTLGQNARFMPSGWLDWQPSNSFRMSVGFETRPVYNSGYNLHNPGRYWLWH